DGQLRGRPPRGTQRRQERRRQSPGAAPGIQCEVRRARVSPTADSRTEEALRGPPVRGGQGCGDGGQARRLARPAIAALSLPRARVSFSSLPWWERGGGRGGLG